MWRGVGKLSPAIAFNIFSKSESSNYDKNRLDSPPPKIPETGLDRVKAMFRTDEFGAISLELHHVSQATFAGIFLGACYGGFIHSRLAYLYFIENNQATAYKSTMEAKSKLQHFVTMSFARGAVKWGWRVGFFTASFTLISTVISVYRGDTSLVEYVSAGAITGALYKANLGLAASAVGAGLGAFLSAVGGFAILSVLKVTGLQIEDIQKAMLKINESRLHQWNQAQEKASEIKNDDLTRHHDTLIEEKGETKIEEL